MLEEQAEARKRVISLPDVLVDLFRLHLEQSDYKEPSDLIFHRPDGSPLNQNHVREGVLYKAGILRGKGTHNFHILRHTAGTIIYSRTGDLKITQQALGHAKISTTGDIYVHLEADVLTVATELMAAEIFANCNPTATQATQMVS